MHSKRKFLKSFAIFIWSFLCLVAYRSLIDKETNNKSAYRESGTALDTVVVPLDRKGSEENTVENMLLGLGETRHEEVAEKSSSKSTLNSVPSAALSDSAPSPVVSDSAPSPVVSYSAPSPVVSDSAPSPVVSDSAPSPVVSYSAPSPVASVADDIEPVKQVIEVIPSLPLPEGDQTEDNDVANAGKSSQASTHSASKHQPQNFPGYVPMLYDIQQPVSDTITILMWDIPHSDEHNRGMTRCNLPAQKSCLYTEDKEMYNRSEAVIISILHSRENIPLYRFPFHKWVFREMEPPPHVWSLRYWKTRDYVRKFGKIFNLTSTTNLDSDVMTGPIFRTCKISEERWKNLKNSAVNYALGKSHRVAWFVSHCATQSRRMEYVKELQKYIPVDIYGVCGNLTCADNFHRQDCDMTLLKDRYKFYLSFENSICKAYVTEKLSRITEKAIPIIPVVLGGANYSFLLPEETYLDVKNFSSPQLLAEFMKKIDRNDDLFNHYVYRKLALECRPYPEGRKPFGCRMCQHLHEKRDEVEIAPDVTEFYGPETQCKRPAEYYRGLTLTPSPEQWMFEW